MTDNEILLDFINYFEPAKVNPLFRELSRGTLRPIEEQLPQYTSAPFSDGYWHGAMQLTDENELIVCSFMINKELSERSGKKEQYNLAKKILKDFQRYTGGFFIFYDAKGDFRFSLIYDVPGPDGKRYGNNFRRYTYFVTKEQTNKTFRTRLSEADFSSFENIIDAFSVEKVTKEFYVELQNWYFWAMNIVEFPDDEDKERNSRNAKNLIRMITRIIFIWFMKEKKLIPLSLFAKSFADDILNYQDKTGSTYYKAILQNLFFATLNTPMRKDNPKSRIFIEDAEKRGYVSDAYLQQGYYRYSRFIKDKEKFLSQFENIPFLNGGLFECLDKQIDGKEIRIDCFSNNPKNEMRLKVPDEIFFRENEKEVDLSKFIETGKNKKVRGLLTILKNYNFTTDENTPIDEEIALDPELLGKVFENLLASYNPETATTARKATGSYYTPREIVDYMVTESLVLHLTNILGDDPDTIEKLKSLFSYADDSNPFESEEETDKIIAAIEKIKIFDPACGSGAFPMGILHKLVLALHKLDPQNLKWEKSLIEKVPIELRDEVEKSLENKSLDYIRKLGLIEHCIFGVDIQEIAIQISKLRFFISLLIEQGVDDSKENRDIRALPNLETKFVAANTLIGLERTKQVQIIGSEVEKLEQELFNIQEQIFYANSRQEKYNLQRKLSAIRQQLQIELKRSGFQVTVAEKVTQWDPFDQNTHADWFDPEWMFGIKNGFDIVIGNPPYIKEYTFRNAFDGVRTSPYYQGKMDLWYLFACKGIDLLRKDTGILTFIAQNNWTTSYGASKMRNKVIQETKIIQLIDFSSYMIFENSGIQTMIMIFKSDSKSDNYTFDYRKLEGKDLNFNDVLDLLNHKQNPKAIFLEPIIKRNHFKNKPFTFSGAQVDEILTKISKKSDFKLNENEIANGIHHHHDRVDKNRKNKLGNNFNIGDGIFVLSNKEKEKIPFTKEELKLIKPSYTTKELGRYYGNRENKEWVIYTDSKFKNPNNIKPYPNIKNHLDKFQKVITSDNKPYGLHRARDEKFFKGEKIIAVRKCIEPTFTYTDFDCYVSATFYVIKTARIDLKYLTALLNSKLIAFWLKHKGKMQGENYQIDKEPLLALPLITMPAPAQKPFIELVDKILSAKKENPQADTGALEKEIDGLVYKLYELTEEEIRVIENKK